MLKHLFRALIAAIFIASAQTAGAQKVEKEIYAFGYATCLGDSVAYVSAIQLLPGATTDKKTGFLQNRHLYTAEMEKTMRSRYGKHFTCALFFNEKKEKVEKQFIKLRHRINDSKRKNLKLVELTPTDFQFTQIIQQ